ncbi:hypothetical protein MRB53_012114 [Persea americana]|uniref:Uncharacterized protein n=1 Tax=Persea americana TaxID=3435 RepID=A0ACC2LY21_PERAE|nr:hypothetical protein MRB53_012114 [Persea americana]
MREYVEKTGLQHLAEMKKSRIDHALINALIERWRPETNTFHFVCGETTITLEDISSLYGLPIDGKAVTGSVWSDKSKVSDTCSRLLGVKGNADKGPSEDYHRSFTITTGIGTKLALLCTRVYRQFGLIQPVPPPFHRRERLDERASTSTVDYSLRNQIFVDAWDRRETAVIGGMAAEISNSELEENGSNGSTQWALKKVDRFLQWQVGSIASITPRQGSDVLYHCTKMIGRKIQDSRGAISSLEALEEFDLEGCINNDNRSSTKRADSRKGEPLPNPECILSIDELTLLENFWEKFHTRPEALSGPCSYITAKELHQIMGLHWISTTADMWYFRRKIVHDMYKEQLISHEALAGILKNSEIS